LNFLLALQSPLGFLIGKRLRSTKTMQQQRIALALVCAFVSASAVTTRLASAETFARSWMQKHEGVQPQGDELAELKTQNPEAYAIVKALLTKRSLGLLDPRHPSASFAKPAHASEEAASGPKAFAKLATPADVHRDLEISASQEASTVYQAVSAPAGHRDWLNWKPKTSAADDEAMVNNVLGAVADLAGKKKAGLLAKRDEAVSPLADDAASLGMDATQEQPSRDNNIVPSARPEKQENSYLKVMGLDAPAPKAKASLNEVKESSGNPLSSFSWDDDAKPQIEQQQKAVEPQEKMQMGAGSNSLLSWLGFTKKQPAPQEHAVSASSKPAAQNPYMMDLQ